MLAGRCGWRVHWVADVASGFESRPSLDPLAIFFDPNCEDPLGWLRRGRGACNYAPRRSGAHGRTRAQRDPTHFVRLREDMSFPGVRLSGGAGTARHPAAGGLNIHHIQKWNPTATLLSLSAHRGSSSLSAAGAPHIKLAMPHVILGDDRAAQAVVVRGAAQARLAPC